MKGEYSRRPARHCRCESLLSPGTELTSIRGRKSFSRYDEIGKHERLEPILRRQQAIDCARRRVITRPARLLQHAAERLRLRRSPSDRAKPLRAKLQVRGQNLYGHGVVLPRIGRADKLLPPPHDVRIFDL